MRPWLLWGVAMKIGMIVAMIQMGLCMGLLPVLAFNMGAGKIRRVKETIWKTGIVCVALGSAMTIGAFAGKACAGYGICNR